LEVFQQSLEPVVRQAHHPELVEWSKEGMPRKSSVANVPGKNSTNALNYLLVQSIPYTVCCRAENGSAKLTINETSSGPPPGEVLVLWMNPYACRSGPAFGGIRISETLRFAPFGFAQGR